MSCVYVDMRGERYGKLVCICPSSKNARSGKYWICICDCGNETEVLRGNLLKGNTISCGCVQKESQRLNGLKSFKHGYTILREGTYITWEAMRGRCNNPNSDWYHRYGGRGIKICERWNDFQNFLDDMGERPEGKTIDRIDPDGDYKPSNCKWSTPKEQSNNKSNK